MKTDQLAASPSPAQVVSWKSGDGAGRGVLYTPANSTCKSTPLVVIRVARRDRYPLGPNRYYPIERFVEGA